MNLQALPVENLQYGLAVAIASYAAALHLPIACLFDNGSSSVFTFRNQFRAALSNILYRRKFFSTDERLRIAEGSCVQSNRQSHASKSSATSSHIGSRPGTADSSGRNSSNMSRRWSRTDAGQLSERITINEAQWFLSLPDKVRQRLFSADEVSVIALRCEAVLQNPCFASIHKLRQLQRRSCSDECAISDSPKRTSMNSARIGSGSDTLPRRGLIEGVGVPFEAHSRAVFKRRDFRRTQSSTMLRVPHPVPRRKAQSQSAASGELLINLPPIPSRNELILSLPSSSSPPPQHNDTTEVTTSKPRYYQDPEARMKLKTYFSSEQKFDELLEFGFPATAEIREQENKSGTPDIDMREGKRASTESRKASETYQRFMLADSLSALSDASSVELESDERDSNSSVDEFDGPATPTEATDATDLYIRYVGQLKSKYSAVDIAKPLSDQRMLPPMPLPPLPSKPKSMAPAPIVHTRHNSKGTNSASTLAVIKPAVATEATSSKPVTGPREMTLKISLTRSDLRTSESNSNDANARVREESNSGDSEGIHAARKADPLALQALPVVSDDVTGAHSPFSAQKSRLQDSVLHLLRGRFARR